jgi:hypothetical protein
MEISLRFALFMLVVVVLLVEWCSEKYSLHELDSFWGVTKESNQRSQTTDPFNRCSPESFDDCARNPMPHLSRY